MTLDTRHATVVGSDNRGGNFRVARATGALCDLRVALADHDVVGKESGGEPPGMVESVLGLGGVFPNEVVRRVAVIALGDGVVPGFHPRVVILLHNVTVRAGGRIVQHI